MKNYHRIMLGKQSAHAAPCLAGGFLGADFGIEEDLSRKLTDEWRAFNKAFIPVYLVRHPGKTKIGAGLACGALWTVCKGLRPGDVVLSPDGQGSYRVGEVVGEYYFAPGQVLPHRRKVQWLDMLIPRSSMSETLQNSTGSIGTTCQITHHREEIDRLLGDRSAAVRPQFATNDPTIEDPLAFAMEKHLEEFLVTNWGQTLLAKEYSIYEEDGEPVGQQYATDAGSIDVLAISKDKKRLLVVELKRGRASDVVVGQILRYMGYIKDQVAEVDQTVEGAIIALGDDKRMRWALLAVPSIAFFRYEIDFRLVKG